MIKILKAIYSILYTDTEIQSIVGNRIFPNVVPDKDSNNENIDYPLIVMRRTELSPEYTKCTDCKDDETVVELTIYANSYFQAVDLAEDVRSALEFYKGVVEDINISMIRLAGATEDYVESVYYQQLIFTIR